MSSIRVLIVEDSPVVGEHLRRIISADPRFVVVGLAGSGEDAIQMLERLAPDVISMDIHLPGMQGFEATQRIMAIRPTPIVVVSGIDMEAVTLTMRALRAGALAVVEKPVATTHADYSALARKLCTQLAIMSEVRVVRQRPLPPRQIPEQPPSRSGKKGYRMLGIAASTGGPAALMQLLCGLGPNFPLPIAVVQHMTPQFLPGFAEWLASVTPYPVSIVDGPTPMLGGNVYLAPAKDFHLVTNELIGMCDDAPLVGGHRPSANALFASMGRTLGDSAIGVVLTGMGDDGAVGIHEMKKAGSYTIAEDESTAVVFGMPGAAIRGEGIHEILPLGDIAPRLLKLTNEIQGASL